MKRRTTTAALKGNREDTPVFADTTDLVTLAAEQGVEPVADFDPLLGDFWPEEESADEFIAAVHDSRYIRPSMKSICSRLPTNALTPSTA